MIRTRVWNDDMIAKAQEMRSKGSTCYDIDLELGVRLGATSEKLRKIAMTPEQKADYYKRKYDKSSLDVRQPPIWSEDKIARAAALLAEGYQMIEIDDALGLKRNSTSRKFSDLRRGHVGRHLSKSVSVDGHVPKRYATWPEPTASEIDERDQRCNAPRTLTALLCGDPPPGFSALDRRR